MPPTFILRFFRLLAGASRSDLHRQVQFLKVENEILRARVNGPIRVTPRERTRLVRVGRPLGTAIRSLISIVRPETFIQWVRQASGQLRQKRIVRKKPGRPRTPEQVRRIVLRIARETGFGYTRILGELKKLGIRNISRSTIVNLLREKGLPTGPQRGE